MRKLFRKKKKGEEGQALVEFVLVLPLFTLILMGIMDFGWLFYNYIGVENCARNAARIACVEYTETNYDAEHKKPYTSQTFNPDFVDTEDYYKDEEVDILKAAISAKPSSVVMKDVKISYSYDVDCEGDYTDYIIQKRKDGSVTVTVHATMHPLTPVMGFMTDSNNNIKLTSTSTYKVETMPADDE